MTARSSVEFVDIRGQRVGNRVVLANQVAGSNVETPLLVDEVTGALAVIDTVHHEIHEGEMVVVSYKSADGAPLADNATIIFLMQTQSRDVHLVSRVGFGGDVELEIRSGTTFTAATGTAMTVVAKNQSVALPGGYATVRRDVTVTNAGTLLFNFFFPGGTGGNAQGISEDTRDEWVFAANTNYMLRATNRAGNAQPGAMAIEWYEE